MSYFAVPQEQPAPHMHVALQAQSLPQVQGSAFVQPHVFLSHRHSFWVVIGFSSFCSGPFCPSSDTQTKEPQRHYTYLAAARGRPRLCNKRKFETSSCDFAG